jgi:phage shock protein E
MEPWMWVAGGVAAALALRTVLGRGAPAALVREKLAAGATVLDVRTPSEFAGGSYPGAVNIPLAALAARTRELRRDRPVVVYCASGVRSARAAAVLRGAGFGDVVNAGGLRAMPRG